MEFSGTVISDAQVGAKFGVATANLQLDQKPDLEEGVYLVDVQTSNFNLQTFSGLLHFGERHTFGSGFSVEIHLLDFEENLYEQTLTLTVLKKLRNTETFPNADALYTQIEQDILRARKYFLRRAIKSHWEAVSDSQREKWASQACDQVAKMTEFQSASVIYAYAPDNYEIPFVEKLCNDFPEKNWHFPRITEGMMTFHPANYQDLKPGYRELLEPGITRDNPGSTPDLLIVPAVAATEDGHRLGRGGGFYDRFLNSPLIKGVGGIHTITILPGFAVLDEIPCEKHDQGVDKVIKIY